MSYRTKTYIAGDWTEDSDAIEKLNTWNNEKKWSLSFNDAHDLTQARDGSLNCSIKTSLSKRMNISKTFVLIVGNKTKNLRSGSCVYCNSYKSFNNSCGRYNIVDYKSYVDYECEKAVKDDLSIIVLYNSAKVNRTKCPDAVKNLGTHVAMCYREGNDLYWDYLSVKKAFN